MPLRISTQSLDLGNPEKLVIGLVADTHSTHHRPALHTGLVPALNAASPDLIFHAGDISNPRVIDQLNQVAPVTAVQGNRDIASSPKLPEAVEIKVCGKSLFLTHGHAPFSHYLIDKTHYMRVGYRFPRYYDYFQQIAPHADVIIFGHTHLPIHQQVRHQTFINPGAACLVNKHDPFPTIAVLTIRRGGVFSVSFKYL